MTRPGDGADSPAARAALAALVAAGDYVAAALHAQAAGDLRHAIQLYQRIWRFADAVPLAEQLGDRPLAVRLALDAGLVPRAVAIADDITADRSAELAAAIEAFEGRGRWGEAAACAARAGLHARAAALFRRAGALLEAARALVRAGSWPEAGRLLGEIAETAHGEDPTLEAEARLEYGTLCAQLGRPRDAARALQVAAAHPSTRRLALARLGPQLAALGLPQAALVIAERLASDAAGLGQARLEGATPAPAPVSDAPTAADDDALAAAAPLSRFSDLALIGGGRTGRVYRARDRLLEQTVVLKIMGVGSTGHTQERLAFRQFLREAEASSRLRHPNIVRLHDVDERAGLLVLEYLAGGTLADRIASGPLSPEAVRRVALDVLGALDAAHRAGIVHRDIKPANIFLDAAGNAKLADFGAAHLADFGGTQTAGFIGTLGYLSPEQISGGAIGPAADLYALGATLFEALTGQLPFAGPDIAGQHLSAAAPRASAARPELLAMHDEVIARALAKNPADRFASAPSMAAAIRGWPAALALPEKLRGDRVGSVAPRGSGSAATADPVAAAAGIPSDLAPAAEPLGATARGQLWRRFDARLGHPVLVEILAAPLDDAVSAHVAALAAAGGPHVQRVLRVENDGAIVYESLDEPGAVTTLAELPAGQRALLAPAWAALAPLGIHPSPQAPVAHTAGGPVILVVAPTGRAYPAPL